MVDLKAIDRLEHDPVHKYLAERFGDDPFDTILDTHGAAEPFLNSEPYLKPGGRYITVGVSFKEWGLWNAISSVLYSYRLALTPGFLGGTPRHWVQIWSDETPKFLDEFRRAAEEGRLKVQVDSVSAMENALQVCFAQRATMAPFN
jgi:NADPH:quinone reductase-like Zn-dependent oxidoreductase